MQLDTLCCLINISFKNNKIFYEIISSVKSLTLFEYFLNKFLEKNEDFDIIYHIIWLISNIIIVNSKSFEHILNSNIIEKVTSILLKNTTLNSQLAEVGIHFLLNSIRDNYKISVNIVKIIFNFRRKLFVRFFYTIVIRI